MPCLNQCAPAIGLTSGEIVSADGSRHDGTAEIIVYAPSREMPVLDGGEKDKMVVCNDEVLWRGMAKVKESRFSGKIMLPHAEPGKIRIAVHFLSDDRKQGSGMTRRYRVASRCRRQIYG